MSGIRKWVAAILLGAGMVAIVSGAARADAIDGSWCYKGRHLAIEGPRILVPSGKQITGQYDRHSFVYQVPPGDEGAGMSVFMVLLDEDTMNLRTGSEQSEPEVWRRCAAPVS